MRFLTAMITLLAATMAPAAADRAAVPLHTPPLTSPIEAAGTGIAPEVTARITIDDSGRVTRVEVVRIEPSTDLDPHFERAVRKRLSTWRYAPALENGKPVEIHMEWTIKFTEIEPVEEQPLEFRWSLFEETDESESYQLHVQSLPLDKRVEMLQRFAETAMEHLDPAETVKHASPRFVVYCDAHDKQVAPAVAQNMEATFAVLDEMLQPWAPPYPEPYRVAVFVYRYAKSFEALKRDVKSVEKFSGFYNPLGLIAIQMEMGSSEALMSAILHEATHAYLDRYISRPGLLLPQWLHEGLACYIGGSTIKKNQLVPGKILASEIYSTPWGLQLGSSGPRITLEEIKKAIRNGEAMGLARLISADREEFYRADMRQFYTLSWLLVHFLRHGEEEWSAGSFPQLVMYIAEGYPPEQALTAVYGPPDELEPRFRRYVLNF